MVLAYSVQECRNARIIDVHHLSMFHNTRKSLTRCATLNRTQFYSNVNACSNPHRATRYVYCEPGFKYLCLYYVQCMSLCSILQCMSASIPQYIPSTAQFHVVFSLHYAKKGAVPRLYLAVIKLTLGEYSSVSVLALTRRACFLTSNTW